MNKLIMRHLSNKERGCWQVGMVIVLCTLYIPSLLLILKPPSQYVAFGTVNFTWTFLSAIIRHYCRILNSDFARHILLPIPIPTSFWESRFFAYASNQIHLMYNNLLFKHWDGEKCYLTLLNAFLFLLFLSSSLAGKL